MKDSQVAVLQHAVAALETGQQVTLVTVVKTWGSSPRPVGAMLAVCTDGTFFGSVSGGCVEDDLLERLALNPPAVSSIVTYGGEAKGESERYGLPCGGTLTLVLEPMLNNKNYWQDIVSTLCRRASLCRELNLVSGEVNYRSAQSSDRTQLEGDRLTAVLGPVWRLLIIGAGEASRYLAEIAQTLGFQVLVCDPRTNYAGAWNSEIGELLEGMPDDVVTKISADSRTAIVALTHDARLDDMALLEALRSDAFYVGALGSVRTNQNRRQRLIEHFGFSEKELSRLRGPVGLSIGSKTPAEIAVSIAAELIASRRGVFL